MTEFITDRQIYEKVIKTLVPDTNRFLWIGTADIKDMYVEKGKQMIPFLSVLDDLIRKKAQIRLIHAKEPGSVFKKEFDRFPLLWKSMERICCPRVHFKIIVIDGKWAYTGSANLTGAGMGAKSNARHNFENGILTNDSTLVEQIMQQFDTIWMGTPCKYCGRKQYCVDRIDRV